MSKEDAYFQFPLYALTFQESVKARCEFIIAYSTVEAGLTLWDNLTDLAREEKIDSLENIEDLPEDTEWDCEKHLAVIIAYRTIGLKGGSMIQMLEKHAQVEQYLAAYEMRNKEDAIVRIKRDLLFDVLHGTGMNYREFAVLCAIHSVIGDKGR